mgnify:CR=1 FL=1
MNSSIIKHLEHFAIQIYHIVVVHNRSHTFCIAFNIFPYDFDAPPISFLFEF